MMKGLAQLVVSAAAVVTAAAAAAGPMCSSSSPNWNPLKGGAYAPTSSAYMNLSHPAASCCSSCESDPKCMAWNAKIESGNCFLFATVPTIIDSHPKQTSITGTKNAPPTPTPPTPPPPPAPKPSNKAMNVLMIAIDDMRPEMEPYGHTHMHTPNIQKLADKSMLFSRAYVQVAVCMPSRNALLFSRRPDTAYAWEISATQWPRTCGGTCGGNICGPTCGIRDPAGGKLGVTLPGWFYENGFTTVGAGKIFHEGSNTQDQDYRHSWTPSTTNPDTGIWDKSDGPTPTYNGKDASPSWFAFDVPDDEMAETKLAEHAVDTIANLSKSSQPGMGDGRPFFLAVGFHKPHVPWYAPKQYWDFYPNETTTLAPNVYKPVGGANIAMQSVMASWSMPKKPGDLSCKYTDLCAEIYPGAPFANGRPGMTAGYPYDNSTFPAWKAIELRRAYWASLSYTDSNIGRVLDALAGSPFADNTVIALWGDHGYALGDNAEWAKQTNFEHATRIPFMVHVPGKAAGITHALVEEVDLFPTLVQAATMNYDASGGGGGPVQVPKCSSDTATSRRTAWCTEGRSLMPLIENASAAWGFAAFSQFPRAGTCCDCPSSSSAGVVAGADVGVGAGAVDDNNASLKLPGPPVCCACDAVKNPNADDKPIMGYTVRVDKFRYTGWFGFNQALGMPDFTEVAATELYLHNEQPLPVDWSMEHVNVVKDPLYADTVAKLHDVLVTCAQRPDNCPPELLAEFVQ